MDRSDIDEKLAEWWRNNKRVFPWRQTRDPYYVLVSEILLHRTKANQVIPVYKRFVNDFPSIAKLADASFDDIKNVVYSLGLLWRSKALHEMAKDIVARLGGKIPVERKELESLTGISHYIASAVRCFAFGYPEILLDTNTVRILGRMFGIKVSDTSRRSKTFQRLYESILDKDNPRNFNYAMLDLGALVCCPHQPLCNECPIIQLCAFGSARLVKMGCGRYLSPS